MFSGTQKLQPLVLRVFFCFFCCRPHTRPRVSEKQNKSLPLQRNHFKYLKKLRLRCNALLLLMPLIRADTWPPELPLTAWIIKTGKQCFESTRTPLRVTARMPRPSTQLGTRSCSQAPRAAHPTRRSTAPSLPCFGYCPARLEMSTHFGDCPVICLFISGGLWRWS